MKKKEIREAIRNEPSHFNATVDGEDPEIGVVINGTTVIEMLPRWWLLKLFEEEDE